MGYRESEGDVAKHGVSFEEAASALLDPFALEAPDLIDSRRPIGEARVVLFARPS